MIFLSRKYKSSWRVNGLTLLYKHLSVEEKRDKYTFTKYAPHSSLLDNEGENTIVDLTDQRDKSTGLKMHHNHKNYKAGCVGNPAGSTTFQVFSEILSLKVIILTWNTEEQSLALLSGVHAKVWRKVVYQLPHLKILSSFVSKLSRTRKINLIPILELIFSETKCSRYINYFC